MKYKSNYIEKINIFPVELQDKILNIVFEEHKKFIKKIDYGYEIFVAMQEKINEYFNNYIIDDRLPLDIGCLDYLSEKEEVVHIFDDDEEPIIYIDRRSMLSDIFNDVDYYNMDEYLLEVELNTFQDEEDEKKDKDFYDYMQWKSRIFTKEDAIITLLNEYNLEIKIQSDNLNLPLEALYEFNHNFLEYIGVVFRDNKVILEWFNGS